MSQHDDRGFRKRAWAKHVFLMGALLALATAANAQAGTLPVAVGGQPLPSLAPMLAKVSPAVVNISSTTHRKVRDPFFDDPIMRQFFGLPMAPPHEAIEQSLGSGVIVDAAKGFILMKPPLQPNTWLLWLAPFLVLAAGGSVAWITVKKASRRST